MTEKRSKYDTDPLDPDFARRACSSVGCCSAPRVVPPISSVRRTKSGSSGSVSYLLLFSDIFLST